jgi:hypothetical protein
MEPKTRIQERQNISRRFARPRAREPAQECGAILARGNSRLADPFRAKPIAPHAAAYPALDELEFGDRALDLSV